MAGTPDQIIDYLRTHPTATALEISASLGMTRANIRHHLDRLLDAEVIEPAGQQVQSGRGRPTRLFRLTPAAQKDNLEGLAGALLAEFLNGLPPGEQQPALERLALRIAAPPDPMARNLTRRVSEAVQQLNDMAYQARWEAHRDGPRIYLTQRPYAGLFTHYSGLLSRLDACVIQLLVGLPVEQKTPAQVLPSIYAILVE